MIDTSQAENALKQVYLDVLRDSLDTQTDAFIGKIEKTKKDVYGKEILIPCAYAHDDGSVSFYNLHQDLASIYFNIELSEKAVRVCESNTGAFVNLLNYELETALTLTKYKIRNAVYYKDCKPEYYPKKAKYELLELSGLDDLFNMKKETLYGVNRKAYNLYPECFKEKQLDRERLKEIVQNENWEIDTVICSSRRYGQLVDYTLDSVKTPDGYHGLFTKDILVQEYHWMPDNEIWFVNSRDFKFHQLCDWQWVEDEEGNILRKNASKSAYNATLVKYGNLICHNPDKQIKITIGG